METTREALKASGAGGLNLICPIRGELRVHQRTPDGLSPTEEALRIDAIHHLLDLGYEKEYILIEPIVRRIGHGGRNSMRADLAVTTEPVARVRARPVEDRVRYCSILVEVKRDSSSAALARETQVEPLLAFGPPGCLAVYWDNVDQRVFWHDKEKQTREGYLAALPPHGQRFAGNPKLTLRRLHQAPSLLALFDRVEDALHTHGVPKQDRYDVMLHLLLAKLFDERGHEGDPDEPLEIQDPAAQGIDADVAKQRFDALLERVAAFYGAGLPRELQTELSISATALAEALSVLAPHAIAHMSRSAMQDFFMRFAKDLYRWDMAQYFTPTPLTEFIVEGANPRAQEQVKDPASGSADFLMTTSERDYGSPNAKPMLYGADMSQTAAHVAELNKILHNATCEIKIEDTLANIDGDFCVRRVRVNGKTIEKGLYNLIICNPPFGSNINVKDPAVLEKFDLGHEWKLDDEGTLRETEKILKSQEVGILFVEACLRQAMNDGGRVAIILPNGYLGNRAQKYVVLREWVLRHARVAAITSFPRFTFKASGADVSASVVFMERRAEALGSSSDGDFYPMAVGLIERVGWEAGVKNGGPTYRMNPDDGTLKLNERNEPVVDADFERTLVALRNSDANDSFPWLAGAIPVPDHARRGHCISIKQVTEDPYRTLDPKRLSAKFFAIRETVAALSHFRLGDAVKVMPELTGPEVKKRVRSDAFRYVEIADVGPGTYSSHELRGWQLPARARHHAQPGDLFVGGIWGSVSKWFVAGHEENLIATNGFHRLKILEPDLLLDIVAGLSSEAFAAQARALARGSDGLAEVPAEDIVDVLFARVTDQNVRAELQPFVDQLLAGQTSLKATVELMMRNGRLAIPSVEPRPSHVVLV